MYMESTSPSSQESSSQESSSSSQQHIDINGNEDNLNDFIAKNTLIGSNLYISPMNNSMIDPSRNKYKNQNQYTNKINSSFFPIVKLN